MTVQPIDRDRLDRLVDQHGPDHHGPDHCGDRDCFTSCVWCDEEWPCPTVDLARLLAAAEHRIRDLTQEVKDERGAALDQIEQVRIRDARIRAVEDVLDQAEASINRHPAYTFSGQRMDPIVNGADIRRALEG